MNRPSNPLLKSPPGRLALAALLVAVSAAVSHAEDSLRIVRTPGGLSPNPVVLSISKKQQGAQVNWQAFGNQLPKGSNNVVYQVIKCPALKGTNTAWTTVATVTNVTTASIPVDGDNGFVAVQQNPAPAYAGADVCMDCHSGSHEGNWMNTAHAGAFETLRNAKMEKNASCLPCHTVGFGTPNGFKDEATTPKLAGVQCENCHGPAYAHSQNPRNKFLLPAKTLKAELCGGCHSDAHHPTYEEWTTSVHGTTIVPEEEFSDPTSGPGRMTTCGACHSAATRVALLNGVRDMQDANISDPSQFAPDMPTTTEASETTITCVACHDPHMKTDNGGQLRFPLASKIPYSYTTATNFAANFNADVQTCGQCHNLRGATWTGTSRPPHHSPQYNILIGNGGFEAGSTNVPQSAHMNIETQCAQCHTHPHSPDTITEATPAFMGHDFNPTMRACAPCHDEAGAELLKDVVQTDTKSQVTQIKGLLDKWATTKAPDALRQKYGVLAWEFNNIGQLSTPTAQNPTGPTATEQKQVPDAIKQARYNLYLIEHDHSYGVHNGNYTRFLLKVSRDLVTAALNQ